MNYLDVVSWEYKNIRRLHYKMRTSAFEEKFKTLTGQQRDEFSKFVQAHKYTEALIYFDLCNKSKYDHLTVVQLREEVRRRGVRNYSIMVKQVLIYNLEKLDEKATLEKVS